MAGELAGKKILLVDDDRDVLEAIQAALADTGAQIDLAGDGNAAVEKASSGKPDGMVLDLMMPKRSGFLVLESIKKGKAKTDPPHVVVITGNTGQRHRAWAESLGAEAYFQKPFRMERLVATITELLS
ncbi:MAG TPA: response regulator [Phycisphaerae bacterium]|nr:response regulator [Phycisphaerae bacterium]